MFTEIYRTYVAPIIDHVVGIWILTPEALNFYEDLGDPRCFFQFEIIMTVLVSSFRFIWIPVLWVYGH